MFYFLCSCSYLFTFLLSSQFCWHIRLKSTAYFFDPYTLYTSAVCCDTLCTSGFTVDIFLPVNRWHGKGVYSKRFNRGQHDSTPRWILQLTHQRAAPDPGGVWYRRLPCFLLFRSPTENGIQRPPRKLVVIRWKQVTSVTDVIVVVRSS